jgi:hypothetical protein
MAGSSRCSCSQSASTRTSVRLMLFLLRGSCGGVCEYRGARS